MANAQISSNCHFCPTELSGAGTINGAHWTGTKYVRVDLCGGCHAAGRLESAPRRKRQPRSQPVYAASDWNMLVAFSGRGGSAREVNA